MKKGLTTSAGEDRGKAPCAKTTHGKGEVASSALGWIDLRAISVFILTHKIPVRFVIYRTMKLQTCTLAC